ncbi:MAG: hypothetical protein IID48_09915 [Proteobacteria bacterium]|nr:hypothetical protein [Pseudomonadota bacterium]
MTDISSLEETVAAAQEAFGRTGEQHLRSRKHLTSLIDIVEENLREKRVALAQSETQRERMIREYGKLRHMLHDLVMTVEVGPRKGPVSIAERAGAGMELGVGMEPEAGMEPESRPESRKGPVPLDPVPLDPAANDAGPARDGGCDPEKLRAGLKRVIKKRRAQAFPADKPKEPAPAS